MIMMTLFKSISPSVFRAEIIYEFIISSMPVPLYFRDLFILLRFEVLTVVKTSGLTLKTEAVRFSETLKTIYKMQPPTSQTLVSPTN
jgi:hypothetical protein